MWRPAQALQVHPSVGQRSGVETPAAAVALSDSNLECPVLPGPAPYLAKACGLQTPVTAGDLSDCPGIVEVCLEHPGRGQQKALAMTQATFKSWPKRFQVVGVIRHSQSSLQPTHLKRTQPCLEEPARPFSEELSRAQLDKPKGDYRRFWQGLAVSDV